MTDPKANDNPGSAGSKAGSKAKEYAERSAAAAAEIATWPDWMQRNLKPPTVSVPAAGTPGKSRVKPKKTGASAKKIRLSEARPNTRLPSGQPKSTLAIKLPSGDRTLADDLPGSY